MSHSTRIGRIDMVATAATLGALVGWSIGPLFIKYLAGQVDSWTQNALRYVVAGLFWLPFLLHSTARGTFAAKTWRRALLPSVANITMQSLWAAGFYYIGPAFMTMLSKTSVLWVAGFSLIVFREERPLMRSVRFWLGLLLSLGGLVGVVAFKDDFSAAGTLTGIVLALSQAFMWGVYTISVRVAFQDIDPRASFSVMSIYAAVGLSVCAFLFGEPSQALTLDVRGWGAVLISSIAAIALAHVFYYTAIRRIGATIPMLVVLGQPFVVFSMSSILFRERMNGIQLLFGAVLLVGSGLSVWAQQHLRAEPPK
ncbi:MAG TPA: DMT family transporter [Sedimentisphaerales bacterium]|jgi:drug/metabolite transporter (DMT)-like permease|nr:DMT family transporter [Sedimentisphaerales bacterium]HNU30280.1 DMT family transporter [Sedimentisphaerales bacterium]